ncbi:MAG: hypothetical protein M3Y39_04630 [Chloroflexota bacterium]|nr:hypothetical protein [Chloroflexota bacterium]
MNDTLNNIGLWLSIMASSAAIISGFVSCIHFLRRQRGQRSDQMTLSNTGQIIYGQRSRDIGYHFSCLLKTAIIIVLIIALATVLIYLIMGILALYLG